jgi:hypothetical protein
VAAELRVGVSVSESADLHRLGLVERHLRLALAEVARAVILSGAAIVYGGHLDPDGYTAFLESELDRYGRTDSPLHLVVGWSGHRRLPLSELRRHADGLGLKAQITYVDASGKTIAPDTGRDEAPAPVDDVPAALNALRRRLVAETDARVLIGGKENDYQGEMPGIVQEALLTVEAGQPLYLAGGFGGATASVAAIAAGLPERWPLAEPADAATTAALDGLRDAIDTSDWTITDNGLDAEENRRLATTHRPSEVASLAAVGLERHFGA